MSNSRCSTGRECRWGSWGTFSFGPLLSLSALPPRVRPLRATTTLSGLSVLVGLGRAAGGKGRLCLRCLSLSRWDDSGSVFGRWRCDEGVWLGRSRERACAPRHETTLPPCRRAQFEDELGRASVVVGLSAFGW